MARKDQTIMAELLLIDRSVSYVQAHTSGAPDSQGNEIAGWHVQYETHQTHLDDIMEKLTRIPEVSRVVQWQPGALFVIRKPPDLPLRALEPRSPDFSELETIQSFTPSQNTSPENSP